MDACLCNLTTELLIKIFQYLPLEDLFRLRLTCHRFNTIITSGLHLFVKNDLLVTNQRMPEMRTRSKIQLSMFDKIRISLNWKAGRYKRIHVHRERSRGMPWLSLEKEFIWISREKYIKCYKRNDYFGPSILSLSVDNTADVCKFVLKQNLLMSGLTDGSVWIWNKKFNRNVVHYENCHKSEINSVDLYNSVLVTGSRDKYCKMWTLNLDEPQNPLNNIYSVQMMDRVWCTAFSPNGQYLLIGTAGCQTPAAFLVDVESNCKIGYLDNSVHQIGAGILDIKWESANMVWTGGYDACLRRWDLRMKGCAQHWEDPWLSTIYCLDYDNYCTAITGVQNHGRTVLWDTRRPDFIQMYFTARDSPVYSLAFDATCLYVATDCRIYLLDFTDSKMQKYDYSNHFSRTIIV